MEQLAPFANKIHLERFAHDVGANGDLRKETWPETAARVARCVLGPYLPGMVGRAGRLIRERKFLPGGRYLYAAGRRYPQIANCALFKVGDSKEEWGRLLNDIALCLMTGAGVGVVYSALRGRGSAIGGMGGWSSGPCSLMNMVNECGRHIRQGGTRRAAIWAGLHWWHPDVEEFITLKDHSVAVLDCRRRDFNFPVPMDATNISVIVDDDFFAAYSDPAWQKTYRVGGDDVHQTHKDAAHVYRLACLRMLRTGEPGFSIDAGGRGGESLRNACTEVCSSDDGDCCNLGSINLGRVDTLEEFSECVEVGATFLLCGSLYGVLPLKKMEAVREKNRRLGLGLMGMHEWLLKRGKPYGPDAELGEWLRVYAESTDRAWEVADRLGVSRPVATRAVAPTGTISQLAETTSGMEPVFSAAYRQRYLVGEKWHGRVTLDPVLKRLATDFDPSFLPHLNRDLVEDAYDLADTPEGVARRLNTQAWLQGFVDQGISSTINLPAWGTPANNEATAEGFMDRLLLVLPKLRGLTCYPDGARGGQPLTRLKWADAVAYLAAGGAEDAAENAEANGLEPPPGPSCASGFCNS